MREGGKEEGREGVGREGGRLALETQRSTTKCVYNFKVGEGLLGMI